MLLATTGAGEAARVVGLVASIAAEGPVEPTGPEGAAPPWWGAAAVMLLAAALFAVVVWLIQAWHRRHDRLRDGSAANLGLESLAGDAEALRRLRRRLAALRVRLDKGQLRNGHAGRIDPWRVTFLDARERDGQYMALGWSGDGRVEPCPRTLVLLERPDMGLPDLMVEPDNIVYRIARGERRGRNSGGDAFDRHNRLAVGDADAAALVDEALRPLLAGNQTLTVRGRGTAVAVSTDATHVPYRRCHAFLAEAMTIADALHETAEAMGLAVGEAAPDHEPDNEPRDEPTDRPTVGTLSLGGSLGFGRGPGTLR